MAEPFWLKPVAISHNNMIFPSNQKLHINLSIDIQLQNVQHSLSLDGVVYYSQHHFTAQTILSDRGVLFHDGIDTGGRLNQFQSSKNITIKRRASSYCYLRLRLDCPRSGLATFCPTWTRT